MIQAFYQTEPQRYTPYRELVLKHDVGKGWHVLVLAGTEWGAGKSTIDSEDSVKDFDDGKIVYDRKFRELQNSGWRPYSPYQDYGSGSEARFQENVRMDLTKPGCWGSVNEKD